MDSMNCFSFCLSFSWAMKVDMSRANFEILFFDKLFKLSGCFILDIELLLLSNYGLFSDDLSVCEVI